jgi:hypothetical protein
MLSLEAAETLLVLHELYDIADDLHGRRLHGAPLPQAEFERLERVVPKDAPEEVWEAFYVLTRACPDAPLLTQVVVPEDEQGEDNFWGESEPSQMITCPHCGGKLQVTPAA